MNERLIFLLAITIAELGASIALFLLLPTSPLVSRFLGLLQYDGAHALPSLGLWALLIGLTLPLMPNLWRRRQNRSSKLAILTRIGIAGLLIDALGSLYLVVRASEESPIGDGSPILHIFLRLGLYLVLFTLTVVIADRIASWHDRRKPPTATPPPRFGRA